MVLGIGFVMIGLGGLIDTISDNYRKVSTELDAISSKGRETSGEAASSAQSTAQAAAAEVVSARASNKGAGRWHWIMGWFRAVWQSAHGFQSLYWMLGGSMVCMSAVLWLSRVLTQQWLDVVAYAFRVLGVLTLVLLGFHMLTLRSREAIADGDRVRNAQELKETKEKADADTQKKEQDAKDELKADKLEEDRMLTLAEDIVKKLGEAKGAMSRQTHFNNAFHRAMGAKDSKGKLLVLQTLYDLMKEEKAEVQNSTLPAPTTTPAGTTENPSLPQNPVQERMLDVLLPGVSFQDLPADTKRFSDSLAPILEKVAAIDRTSDPYGAYLGLVSKFSVVTKARDDAQKALEEAKTETVKNSVETINKDENLKNAVVTAEAAQGAASSSATPDAQPKTALLINDTQIVQALAAVSSTDENAQKLAQRVIDVAPDRLEKALETAPTVISSTVRPRVYIQVPTQELAESIRAKRADAPKDFIFPGVRVVGMRGSPNITEVRYFDPASEAMAQTLASIMVNNWGFRDVQIHYQRPTKQAVKVSQHIATHFEVWFGAKTQVPEAAAPSPPPSAP
ncbi:MAG: hypothetical protein ACO1TE_08970 [Prosthecobacter sp.]